MGLWWKWRCGLRCAEMTHMFSRVRCAARSKSRLSGNHLNLNSSSWTLQKHEKCFHKCCKERLRTLNDVNCSWSVGLSSFMVVPSRNFRSGDVVTSLTIRRQAELQWNCSTQRALCEILIVRRMGSTGFRWCEASLWAENDPNTLCVFR